MPVLRCLEPGFVETLKNSLNRNDADYSESNLNKDNQETSLAFLASKLNLELVSSILKGITRFALVDIE